MKGGIIAAHMQSVPSTVIKHKSNDIRFWGLLQPMRAKTCTSKVRKIPHKDLN